MFVDVQDMSQKIEDQYRVRLILDNLPITTYDLERGPESVRPGEPCCSTSVCGCGCGCTMPGRGAAVAMSCTASSEVVAEYLAAD